MRNCTTSQKIFTKKARLGRVFARPPAQTLWVAAGGSVMMKKINVLICVCLIAGVFFHAAEVQEAQAAPSLSAKDILNQVDDLYRGDSAHGKMRMSVTTKHWSRTLSLEFWSKGTKRSLVRILSPLKEKGTATLMVENDIWNYLPKVKRVIKLPSSMMGGSWMGSHFTNDDLVKQSRMTEDYTFDITFNGMRGNQKTLEITCIPKEEAAVVWGKVVVEVADKTWLPISMHYFDEDMVETRVMHFFQRKDFSGQKAPYRASCGSLEQEQ